MFIYHLFYRPDMNREVSCSSDDFIMMVNLSSVTLLIFFFLSFFQQQAFDGGKISKYVPDLSIKSGGKSEFSNSRSSSAPAVKHNTFPLPVKGNFPCPGRPVPPSCQGNRYVAFYLCWSATGLHSWVTQIYLMLLYFCF